MSSEEVSGKVKSRSSNDSVQEFNPLGIEVKFPRGKIPDFVLEFLQGLVSKAS